MTGTDCNDRSAGPRVTRRALLEGAGAVALAAAAPVAAQTGPLASVLADILAAQMPLGDVTFCNYQDACGADGGLLGHFLRQLGLEGEPPATPVQRQNESRAAVEVWIANTISAPAVAPAALIEQVAQVLAQQFPALRGGTIFTPDEIARLQKRFEPANRYFETRVQPSSPGFRIPHLQGFAGRPPRDAIGPEVWDAVKAAL